MKALDTNILVRLLVKDDPAQSRRAFAALDESEKRREILFVPKVVVLELIWVLSSSYGKSRSEVLDSLESLFNIVWLRFEASEMIRSLIQEARGSTFDLADLLIGLSAQEAGCETTLTFDRQAARSRLFTEL